MVPAWFQFSQNAALHLITGNHKASSISHLGAEATFMPVADHLMCRILGLLHAPFSFFTQSCADPSWSKVLLRSMTRLLFTCVKGSFLTSSTKRQET
jgi:hypothetical protein